MINMAEHNTEKSIRTTIEKDQSQFTEKLPSYEQSKEKYNLDRKGSPPLGIVICQEKTLNQLERNNLHYPQKQINQNRLQNKEHLQNSCDVVCSVSQFDKRIEDQKKLLQSKINQWNDIRESFRLTQENSSDSLQSLGNKLIDFSATFNNLLCHFTHNKVPSQNVKKLFFSNEINNNQKHSADLKQIIREFQNLKKSTYAFQQYIFDLEQENIKLKQLHLQNIDKVWHSIQAQKDLKQQLHAKDKLQCKFLQSKIKSIQERHQKQIKRFQQLLKVKDKDTQQLIWQNQKNMAQMGNSTKHVYFQKKQSSQAHYRHDRILIPNLDSSVQYRTNNPQNRSSSNQSAKYQKLQFKNSEQFNLAEARLIQREDALQERERRLLEKEQQFYRIESRIKSQLRKINSKETSMNTKYLSKYKDEKIKQNYNTIERKQNDTGQNQKIYHNLYDQRIDEIDYYQNLKRSNLSTNYKLPLPSSSWLMRETSNKLSNLLNVKKYLHGTPPHRFSQGPSYLESQRSRSNSIQAQKILYRLKQQKLDSTRVCEYTKQFQTHYRCQRKANSVASSINKDVNKPHRANNKSLQTPKTAIVESQNTDFHIQSKTKTKSTSKYKQYEKDINLKLIEDKVNQIRSKKVMI